MSQDYPRLSYKDFGADLLTTYDLDPIYPMLARAELEPDVLKRWLLAYWCYYSAGPASYVAERPSKEFYFVMGSGIPSWPRGHERRHWRADAALNSLTSLREFGSPEEVVDFMTVHDDFPSISKNVQTFTGFGPWISWKIADMAERVLGYPVDFTDTDMFMFKDPVKGAALVLKGDEDAKLTLEELGLVVRRTLKIFKNYKAPPYDDRPINIQEVETILCKWKSHMHGHYPLGNDVHDIASGLLSQDWGKLAKKMYKCLQLSVTYEV